MVEFLSWKDKKNRIYDLVKLISESHEGDYEDFLNEYCSEIIHKHKSNLDLPLKCFQKIITDNKFVGKYITKNEIDICVCQKCKYVAPFCRCKTKWSTWPNTVLSGL